VVTAVCACAGDVGAARRPVVRTRLTGKARAFILDDLDPNGNFMRPLFLGPERVGALDLRFRSGRVVRPLR
jgi:hypothetical protein